MKWMRSVADVFMPRVCAVCGRRLNLNESFLCLHCLADMPLTRFWGRTRNPMADRFNGLISDSGYDGGERYAYACPLFFFEAESPYRNILYEIKYKGHIALGTHMGHMLGEELFCFLHYGTPIQIVLCKRECKVFVGRQLVKP